MKRRMNQNRNRQWIVLLALLAVSYVAAALTVESDPTRLSLESFPKGMVEISSSAGPQRFHIWVADTAARSEQGLMFVRSLNPDQGMLFPRNNVGPMAMWMKNTLIPLDMLFLDAEGEILYIRHSATPKSEQIITVPAPMTTPIQAVLELSGGE